MIERRSEPRQKSLLGGSVAFERWQSSFDCVVRNVSEHGALVVFPHTAIMPREFHLRIPQRRQMKYAKVVWRGADRVGVTLMDAEPAPAPIDQAKRIRMLEAETRRLRRQLDPGAW